MLRYTLINQDIRARAVAAVQQAADGSVVMIREGDGRTLDQNALLWPLLHTVSQQVEWYGKKLTPENWKDIFSAALKRQQVVPGIDGGFVVLGQSTSRMSKKEFSELIEFIYAFGAQRGINWEDEHGATAELAHGNRSQSRTVRPTGYRP